MEPSPESPTAIKIRAELPSQHPFPLLLPSGKMFKSLDLSVIVEFILMFYRDKPIDWLLDHILWVKVCNPEKDAVSRACTETGRGGGASSLRQGLCWKLCPQQEETMLLPGGVSVFRGGVKLSPSVSPSLHRSIVTGRRPTCGSASSRPSSSMWVLTPHWRARSRN